MLIRKRLWAEIFILAVVVFASIVISQRKGDFLNFRDKLSNVSVPAEILNPLAEHSLLPEPLRREGDGSQSQLTRAGVFGATNKERAVFGLPALKENQLLNKVATAKLEDMFARQYFEHESPTGKGPSGLAEDIGYEYVIVGENLALGNFKSDADLVTAWMNSPGHRQNILHKRFSEIGTAVGSGLFEGKKTWLAVQSFGTPLSSCPNASEELKVEVTTNQKLLQIMEAELNQMKAELDASRGSDEYNQKVEAYNKKIGQFNALVEKTKYQVATYNAQVNSFNTCVAE